MYLPAYTWTAENRRAGWEGCVYKGAKRQRLSQRTKRKEREKRGAETMLWKSQAVEMFVILILGKKHWEISSNRITAKCFWWVLKKLTKGVILGIWWSRNFYSKQTTDTSGFLERLLTDWVEWSLKQQMLWIWALTANTQTNSRVSAHVYLTFLLVFSNEWTIYRGMRQL